MDKEVWFYCCVRYLDNEYFHTNNKNDMIRFIPTTQCVTIYKDGTTDCFGYYKYKAARQKNDRFIYSIMYNNLRRMCRIIEYSSTPINNNLTNSKRIKKLLSEYKRFKKDIDYAKRYWIGGDK